MEPFKEFIFRNFKMLSIMLSFIVTIYIQHVGNIARINELTVRCNNIELRIKDQYEKIDAIKLDKAVFEATMPERQADSLLRSDLRQKCRVFRRFGRDSLLLGVLAYNVGEYRLLGDGEHPQSRLIRKLEAGDRDIYAEYVTFRKYKGKVLPSLERRRKTEFQILYEK